MYQDINLYLAGEWIPASQGGTRPVLNPATEEPVGTIADATADDLNKALSAADRGVPFGAILDHGTGPANFAAPSTSFASASTQSQP